MLDSKTTFWYTVGPRFSAHPDLVTKTLSPEDVTKSGSDWATVQPRTQICSILFVRYLNHRDFVFRLLVQLCIHEFLSSQLHRAGKFSIMLEHNAINLWEEWPQYIIVRGGGVNGGWEGVLPINKVVTCHCTCSLAEKTKMRGRTQYPRFLTNKHLGIKDTSHSVARAYFWEEWPQYIIVRGGGLGGCIGIPNKVVTCHCTCSLADVTKPRRNALVQKTGAALTWYDQNLCAPRGDKSHNSLRKTTVTIHNFIRNPYEGGMKNLGKHAMILCSLPIVRAK
eukprot:sb/3467894/